MITDEKDYVRERADEISAAFDGNPCYDNMGTLKEIQRVGELLVDGLSKIIAMLINQRVLNIEEVKSILMQGWRIKEEPKE